MNERLNKQLDFLSGVVLMAFPVVLLFDDLFPGEALPVKFVVGLCAVWLLGASIVALARLVWVYRPRAVIVAGALGLVGVFGSVGIMVFRFLTGTIRQFESAVGSQAQFEAAIGKTQPLIFAPGLITPLVLCFLAAMLFRFESRAKWAWATVCVGCLLFPAGRIFLGTPVVLLSDALLLIGLGYIGCQMILGKRDVTTKDSLETNAA